MSANHIFYIEISKLRDLFYKYGRFDDSNAKLDEISKYIAIYLYQILYSTHLEYSDRNLKDILALYKRDSSFNLIGQLKAIFTQVAVSDVFIDAAGVSIFGDEPTLNIDNTDSQFACSIIELAIASVDSVLQENRSGPSFDLLNESFGHFVRDNFRNHVEDAQYMTPAEVVELMVSMALHDLVQENSNPNADNFIVCDPCCGVGSFLSAFYRQSREKLIIERQHLFLLGQDKVARMVRLSKINLLLGNVKNHAIAHGNSLVGSSILDDYREQIDLILTNPPFGARFSAKELSQEPHHKYPLLRDLFEHHNLNFDSELLFIDRCIALLKTGGKLLAVAPDSALSSMGLNAMFRDRLLNSGMIRIRAVVELPGVTFAQAGTRTKTSIIYLEKLAGLEKKSTLQRHIESDCTFMATSKNIGFDVIVKRGATLKIDAGYNDLIDILKLYQNSQIALSQKEYKFLSQEPVCVTIAPELLASYSWIPSHYQAFKYDFVHSFKYSDRSDIDLVKLNDIADFMTRERRKEPIDPQSKCISILHITSDRSLDYAEMLNYHPKYQGITCHSGDLLFSKINPRIPRLLIVPSLDFPITCSPEFEIMAPKLEISNYGLQLLLSLPSVQMQVNSLTAGTSASHNRIKTVDLANILIPLPKNNTSLYADWITKVRACEQKEKEVWQTRMEMHRIRNSAIAMLS
jgi:type I restriction-modification system DNA methylase subunit